MKILVIEDEKLLADAIKALLESKGFCVEAVYDGQTGADYAELGVYDLLILDVMMPGLDGYAVARQVRAKRCARPILMLTARAAVEDRIEGLNAGADYYLTKPFDTRELLACINALLQAAANRPFSADRPFAAGRPDAVNLPYFVLQFGRHGELLTAGADTVTPDDEQTLQKIVDAALQSPDSVGVLKDEQLRFLRTDTPEGLRILYADISSELATMRNLRRNCVLIGVLGFAGFLFISFLLARWAVKPVEKAWQQQRQFVADASHELKTPLSVILTNAELLQAEGCGAEEETGFAANILLMANRMRALIAGLLELARADNGAVRQAFAHVDLSALVENAALPYEPMYYEKGLSLRCEIEPGVTVTGSQMHLTQTFCILLDNALKYSAPGAAVELRLKRQGRHCLLRVSNEAPPIEPEKLKYLFERFYRADAARNAPDSYGLGLSIAERIVKEHKGRIWAESSGGWNRFFVQLPL